jgi:hypothetical protein
MVDTDFASFVDGRPIGAAPGGHGYRVRAAGLVGVLVAAAILGTALAAGFHPSDLPERRPSTVNGTPTAELIVESTVESTVSRPRLVPGGGLNSGDGLAVPPRDTASESPAPPTSSTAPLAPPPTLKKTRQEHAARTKPVSRWTSDEWAEFHRDRSCPDDPDVDHRWVEVIQPGSGTPRDSHSAANRAAQ